VRHPLDATAFFLCAGIPLVLGSLWALAPAALGVVAIVARTALEDRMLQDELAGYKQYTGRVRYRLVPGVW
jgi:protein-S-isoprenylcysteine O-methyltransferase Ste14